MAGLSWSLTPNGKFRLETGRGNPYYADGRTGFEWIVSNGVVTGFSFGGEDYTKAQTVLHMSTTAPAPTGNRDGGRNVAA